MNTAPEMRCHSAGSTAVFTLHVPDQVEPNEYPVEEKRNFPIEICMPPIMTSVPRKRTESLRSPRPGNRSVCRRKFPWISLLDHTCLEFSQKGKKILYHRKAVFNISKQIPVGDYERL